MDNNVVPHGFGSLEVVVVDTIDEEEDPEENPKEEENPERSKSSGDYDGLEYLRDPEDFDPWND